MQAQDSTRLIILAGQVRQIIIDDDDGENIEFYNF